MRSRRRRSPVGRSYPGTTFARGLDWARLSMGRCCWTCPVSRCLTRRLARCETRRPGPGPGLHRQGDDDLAVAAAPRQGLRGKGGFRRGTGRSGLAAPGRRPAARVEGGEDPPPAYGRKPKSYGPCFDGAGSGREDDLQRRAGPDSGPGHPPGSRPARPDRFRRRAGTEGAPRPRPRRRTARATVAPRRRVPAICSALAGPRAALSGWSQGDEDAKGRGALTKRAARIAVAAGCGLQDRAWLSRSQTETSFRAARRGRVGWNRAVGPRARQRSVKTSPVAA